MKKQLFNTFAVLCCVVGCAVAGKASAHRTEFKIPFDFIIKNRTLPAGSYSIGRLNAANPDVLVLEQIGGKIKTVFQAQRVGGGDGRFTQPRLTFNHGADGYFLTGIRELGESFGYRILSKAASLRRPKIKELFGRAFLSERRNVFPKMSYLNNGRILHLISENDARKKIKEIKTDA